MQTTKFTELGELPPNTILLGGHPRWQKFFKQKYPFVKIIRDNSRSFNVDKIATCDLLLINSLHMNHAQMQKIQKVLKSVPYRYVK